MVGEYRAIPADHAILDEVIRDLRKGGLDGVNVTMPLKSAALERCDRLTAEAQKAGSVNSLRVRDGVLEGHSTDVVAFDASYALLGDIPALLVLGWGGAANAAVAAWPGDEAAHVSVRDTAKLAGAMVPGKVVTPVRWGKGVPGALVVNATPLGMHGETLPDGVLTGAAALIDLPYTTAPTPAVIAANDSGILVLDGIAFLASQATASFEWWTGVAVDSGYLESVARNA
jgi:shikimate dehydrogenase